LESVGTVGDTPVRETETTLEAVWAYNYFTNKVEAFDVEMDNSSMELINYFILRRGSVKK
jgi:hypothetical protein